MNRSTPPQSPFSDSGARQGDPSRTPFGATATTGAAAGQAPRAQNTWGAPAGAPVAPVAPQAPVAPAPGAWGGTRAQTPPAARQDQVPLASDTASAAPVIAQAITPALQPEDAPAEAADDALRSARRLQDRVSASREELSHEESAPAPSEPAARAPAPSGSANASGSGKRPPMEGLDRARALLISEFLKQSGAIPNPGNKKEASWPNGDTLSVKPPMGWDGVFKGQPAHGKDIIALVQAVYGVNFTGAVKKINAEFSAAIDRSLEIKARHEERLAQAKAPDADASSAAAPAAQKPAQARAPASSNANRAPAGARRDGPPPDFAEMTKHVRDLRPDLILQKNNAVKQPQDGEHWLVEKVGVFTLIGQSWILEPAEGTKPAKVEGRDAVDLTRAIRGLGFNPAIKYLEREFAGQLDDPSFKVTEEDKFALLRAKTDALAEKVRDIELYMVMEQLGGIPNQDKDRNKWKIDGVGNISIKGQMWNNLNEGTGGRDAIGLVRHALNLSYSKAINWLADQFSASLDSGDIRAVASSGETEKKGYRPPQRDDTALKYVRHYLRFKRGLPEQLIERLISNRTLYANEERACIFASEGIAEIRSTFDGPDSVKKLAPGSSRNFGFVVSPAIGAPAERALGICESAIDSLSYHVLNPTHSAISCAGASKEFSRQVALEAASNNVAIVAAFDADTVGDKASQALFNFFYLMTWLNKREKLSQEEIIEMFGSKKIDIGLVTPRPDAATGDDGMTSEEREEEARLGHLNRLFFNDANPFSGDNGAPVIVWRAKKPIGSIPIGEHTLPVNPTAHKFIVDHFQISRARPSIGKDWNEQMKTLTAEQNAEAGAPAPDNAVELAPEARFRGPRA